MSRVHPDRDLIARLLNGDRRALARVLTYIERGESAGRRLLAELYAHTGHAHIVGVTGAPGSGKSTLVTCMAQQWRKRERSVAVLAVDPTSPYSGGALLGDRIRMQDLHGDSGVYIRSMAARERSGGLARTSRNVMRALDAAGFDLIIIETVGAGQSEVEVAQSAHTVIVVEVPGLGDDIQAIKAGILEIADVFAVNKADLEGSARLAAQLRTMLALGTTARAWTPPVIKTVATTGEGVAELLDAAGRHWDFLNVSGKLRQLEQSQAERELLLTAQDLLMEQLHERAGDATIRQIAGDLAERRSDPHEAAIRLLSTAGLMYGRNEG